jgi:hypothetical protein
MTTLVDYEPTFESLALERLKHALKKLGQNANL